jgi:geranylgeranyl pyrophosphate synthase
VARARDSRLAAVDVRELRTAADAAEICERIINTGALDNARSRAFELVEAAKRELPGLPERQQTALELVADGVVERYA